MASRAVNPEHHMTTPTIQEAQTNDSDAVVALFAEDLTSLRLPVDRQTLAAVFAQMIEDNRAVVLVCRLEAHSPAVGVLVASRMLSVKHGGRSLWIEELYVAKQARKRGLGRALVEALLARAETDGIRGVDLEAYHGNDAAALLYRSLGFRRLGRERFTYYMEWEDEFDE